MVKYANLGVAIALAGALALVCWYAWRPLPQRSGRIAAPLSAAATVSFDNLGVPHIRAADQEDALFLQGYVTAQDRLWQMDGLRRFSAGDLAEILGQAGLESDRDARRLRIRRIAEAGYATLPAADRAAFAAYARGVNHFIAQHLGACRSSSPCSATSPGRGAWWIRWWSACTCFGPSPLHGATIF